MHVCTIQQCPNYLKKKLNPAQYSEKSSCSAVSPIKITRNANVWILKAKGKCIFPKIKHFDGMALSRIKTVIAYAARGKIVTLVRLDSASINNNFFAHGTLTRATIHDILKLQTL